LGMGGRRRVALRRDDQEARGRAARALADPLEQRLADDGLVRDDEDVRLAALLALHVGDDVLNRDRAGGRADAVDDVPPQPPRLRLRVGRHDDRVRLELGDRVAHGADGVGVDDEPVGGDAGAAEQLERVVEPSPGGRATGVLVDDVALARVVDRAQDGDADRTLARLPLHLVEWALPGDGLVRDREDLLRRFFGAHGPRTCSSSPARSPFRTAWRAPGTPYSYGLPTTCGISSKLKIGGGEETCHSSVSARQ